MSIADENCSGNVGHLTSALVAGDGMPALNSDDTETTRHDLLKVARESIPPGRTNRKLRGHVAEVKSLHEAGYSITGIQQVLAATGIQVGRSAVARELVKLAAAAAAAAPTPAPNVEATAPEKTSIETVTVNS